MSYQLSIIIILYTQSFVTAKTHTCALSHQAWDIIWWGEDKLLICRKKQDSITESQSVFTLLYIRLFAPFSLFSAHLFSDKLIYLLDWLYSTGERWKVQGTVQASKHCKAWDLLCKPDNYALSAMCSFMKEPDTPSLCFYFRCFFPVHLELGGMLIILFHVYVALQTFKMLLIPLKSQLFNHQWHCWPITPQRTRLLT